jgi:hypothetical protein
MSEEKSNNQPKHIEEDGLQVPAQPQPKVSPVKLFGAQTEPALAEIQEDPVEEIVEEIEEEVEMDLAQTPKDQPFSFIKNLLRGVVFAALSLSLLGVNIFFEGSLAESDDLKVDTFSSFDYEEENQIPENGIVRFEDEASMNVLSADNDYVFELENGRLWGNFLYFNDELNILISDKLVLIPRYAVFDLEFDGEKITLSVYNGDVYIGFLSDFDEISDPFSPYSPTFGNSMLVPRNTQVSIPLTKLDERIYSLLNSKLIKEFKYSIIPEAITESEWVKNNERKDNQLLSKMERELDEEILYNKRVLDEGFLKRIWRFFERKLTFVGDKKDLNDEKEQFAYLDAALYFANQKNEIDMLKNLDDFDEYFMEKGEGFDFDEYLESLMVVSVNDKLHEIYINLLNKKIEQDGEAEKALSALWRDVYQAIDEGNIFAIEALNTYFKSWGKLKSASFSEEGYRHYLIFQNQLVGNLFLKFPIFYKDLYFENKYRLEQKLLDLYVQGQLRVELLNDFVSQKISYLKRLKRFFFGDNIKVVDAREIILRLVKEVQEFIPEESNLAVIELFETQLGDIGDFWGYLNTPEYNNSAIYGASHQDRYEIYLEEKDKIWRFIDIQENINGEKVETEISVSDVEDEIEAVFEENLDFKNVEIGEIDDVSQRYVDVTAIIYGYSLEAIYDRDNEALRDVYVYGELISDRPVKLDGLLDVLEDKFELLVEDEIEEDEKGLDQELVESHAQRIARIYIAGKIAELGFELNEQNVKLVNDIKSEYRISNINLEDYPDVQLSFDYSASRELALNIFFYYENEPVVLSDEYTLEQLKELIISGVENLDEYKQNPSRKRSR